MGRPALLQVRVRYSAAACYSLEDIELGPGHAGEVQDLGQHQPGAQELGERLGQESGADMGEETQEPGPGRQVGGVLCAVQRGGSEEQLSHDGGPSAPSDASLGACPREAQGAGHVPAALVPPQRAGLGGIAGVADPVADPRAGRRPRTAPAMEPVEVEVVVEIVRACGLQVRLACEGVCGRGVGAGRLAGGVRRGRGARFGTRRRA